MKESISEKIFHTLRNGKERLSSEALSRMVDFVRSQSHSSGAFVNKSGQPDLYYTLYGLTLSYIFGIGVDRKLCRSYLNSQHEHATDIVHYASYMRCKMILRLYQYGKAALLTRLLKPENLADLDNLSGYPNGDKSSPYAQYLRLGLTEDAGCKVKNKESVLQALDRYRTPQGGFSNIVGSRQATTNATAAALSVSGQLSGYGSNPDVACLQNCQTASGGFCATPDAPMPDILSTATALFTLHCYGVAPKHSPVDFIEAHWLDDGGFSATILDDSSDVEYTFYGLLALGAL